MDVARIEPLFRNAIALPPRWADAHLQLGIFLQEQHRDAGALPEFQTAVQLSPDNPQAHFHLAQAYLRAGDNSRGQDELQRYNDLRKRQAGQIEKQQ